ncbi:hypothetical protein ACOTF2_07165 [Achromobacter xylosoxidans]
MRAHVVEAGSVVNTIEVDDLSHPVGDGQLLVPGDQGGIGWRFADGVLSPPDSPGEPTSPVAGVPVEVDAAQAYAALMQMGLFEAVSNWANSPGTDPLHKIAFEKARNFRRDSPALEAGRVALGWSDAQLDQLFIAAAAIRL